MVEVFCTRELEKPYHQMALQEGIKIKDQNFIHPVPVIDEELQASVLSQLNNPDCQLLFTSKNAVRLAFKNYLGSLPEDAINKWTFYCIAGATRDALLEYIPPERIMGAADYAEELIPHIAKRKSGSALHFFCGDKRRNLLPDFMNDSQIPYKEWAIYKTVASPQQITDTYRAYLFYSPSAVESFFSINTLKPAKPCFAIGKTTAEALKSKITNPVFISKRTNTLQLLQLLFNYFKTSHVPAEK